MTVDQVLRAVTDPIRRDDLIEMAFPGLPAALDLPRGKGFWRETV